MAKPKKNTDNPYDAELEQHVDELLAPESKSKKIDISHDTEPERSPVEDATPVEITEPAEAVTAPLLPDTPIPTEPTKIPITQGEKIQPAPKKVIKPLEPQEVEEPLPELSDDTATIDESIKLIEPTLTINEALLTDALDDDHTDKLVNDIVAKEGDELLAAEDERTRQFTPITKPTFKARLGAFFAAWWHNPIARWITIGVIVAALAVGIGMPASRYYVLNNVGVRSSASVTVTDRSTQLPLKNVTVKIADQIGQTDDKGVVRLQHLRLGKTTLSIEKRAFAPITQNITIGWGSNPLVGYQLLPAGSQYTFAITDYLSGKPIKTATVASEYADANADDKGIATLTLDKNAKDTVDVTITSPGLRDEHVTLNTDSKSQIAVQMVSARKHAYVSNRSGNYDVYKIDVDGKNDQVVLPGSGNERADMVIASDPNDNIVAVVSTREPVRNKDGYLLSTLTMVDLDSGATVKVSQSEQIQIVGWNNGRLAYVQIASGASAANPDRERLMSYDYAKRDNKQLTSANYFNDVLAVGDSIYYAPTGALNDPVGNFTKIKYDGSGKQVILVGETWNAFRIDYGHIVLSVPGAWYQHVIGSVTATKLDGQPANTNSRVYVDSPDGKHSLWVDNRDGKGVLLNHDVATGKDTTLLTKSGLRYPVKWLDNHTLIYRVSTDNEIADYVLSLDGGEPHKIHDVTTTGSNDRWYYY